MRKTGPNNPADGVVSLVDRIIADAVKARASDIHFEPSDAALLVRFRVDGRLHHVESLPLVIQPNVVTRLKVMAGLLSYRIDIPQEGGLTLPGDPPLDLRISTFPTIRAERVAVRLLPRTTNVRTLGELGLSDALVTRFVAAADTMQGLVLVTGPAGSGKTTTLYALLSHLRERRPEISLMTVEDPVELRLDGVAQIQVTPHGELTYPRALRSLLRQDPQVILIGEIRDAETAQIATEAALTGHLILSTMHSGHVVEALVRMREMGVPAFQITSTLRLVTCQRLLRTRCDMCQGRSSLPAGTPSAGTGRGESAESEKTPPAGNVVQDATSAVLGTIAPSRCAGCFGTGFHGRTACAESAVMSDELRAAILEGADTRRLAQAIARQPGHVTLAEDGERHVTAGRTTRDEVQGWMTHAGL